MEITLKELLDEREERVKKQKELIDKYGQPLICFTMNIAGPIKTSPKILRAFFYGLERLDSGLEKYAVSKHIADCKKTGPVAFYSVNGDPSKIKDICINVEESCRMGRLFDMDVIGVDGKKLERQNERHCIVCEKKGRECAAGRLHSVEELQSVTDDIITSHFAESDRKAIATLAKESLIEEVRTTVKPGLVDMQGNGSHTDMTVDTFEKSANALLPYFEDCIRIGIDTSERSAEHTFALLRQAGIKAEKAMYQATNGVNTHKGIIYSLGIILGAVGRLWRADIPYAETDAVLEECSAITKKAAEDDLANTDGSTAGGRLYLLNGERGIRGEASDGFPSVKNISLPAYKKALNEGKNKNDAGVITLLHLIANIYDTSIFNRGGEDGVAYAQNYASTLLAKSIITTADTVKMDNDFIKKNLSPGGSADLLAITYFLAKIEDLKIDQPQ